jgi:hypothetical protein
MKLVMMQVEADTSVIDADRFRDSALDDPAIRDLAIRYEALFGAGSADGRM